MARKKTDTDGAGDEAEAPAPKRPRRDTAETVAQVAYAIRNRDAIVEHALEVLGALGVLDERTQAHVRGLYERGDARTRLIIQELIARVMRVPVDRLEQALEDEEWDADAMSSRALDALTTLELPEVDVKRTADWVRDVDLDGLILRAENKSKVLRFVGDIPVKVHKLQRNMMLGGIALLAVVAVSLLFPDQALWIAFFGLLTLLGLLGGLLIKWSWGIRRLAKDADLDLVVLARLKPEERRLLLLRRLVVQVFDQARAGDLLERGLGAVVPDLLRGDERAAAAAERPSSQAARPARPVKPAVEKRPSSRAPQANADQDAEPKPTTKAKRKATAKAGSKAQTAAGKKEGKAGPTKDTTKRAKRSGRGGQRTGGDA